MLEHKSIQRATAREQPGVIEHESIQRATAKEQPGVLAHKARQRRMANAKKACSYGNQVCKWQISISSAVWLMGPGVLAAKETLYRKGTKQFYSLIIKKQDPESA